VILVERLLDSADIHAGKLSYRTGSVVTICIDSTINGAPRIRSTAAKSTEQKQGKPVRENMEEDDKWHTDLSKSSSHKWHEQSIWECKPKDGEQRV
jgi:hypothetical protein